MGARRGRRRAARAIFYVALFVAPRAAHAQNDGADPDPTAPPAPQPQPMPAPPSQPWPAPSPLTPAAASPPADASSPDPEVVWRRDFDRAREDLLAGAFADARDEFDRLARLAPSDVDRAVALEDRDLATTWLARDLALVRRVDLGETNLTPKAVDRRTSDEIVSLYTASVVYGIGTGTWVGVGIGSTSNNPGSATYILPPILFTAASVGGVALADSQHAFRYGGAQAAVSGMYIGLEEGIVWSLVDENVDDRKSRMSPTAAGALIWGTSTVGLVGGGILGAAHATTPGRASFVGSAALWSSVLTASVATAVQKKGGSDVATFTAAGVALNAGLVGGLLLAEPVSPTIARVRFLDLGGATGYLVGAGFYLAGANNNSNAQAAFGCAAIGSGLGLASAWFLTQSMQDDRLSPRPHEESLLERMSPSIIPLDRGAAFGVQGSL